MEGRHGFVFGITNISGENFKTVVDPKGNASRKPMGTVTIFTGKAKWMFDQKEKEGKLEHVLYGDMSPAEQSMIRNLVNAKRLSFPLARFRTINTNKMMPNRVAGTNNKVPNEDYGAMNVFLYLGWNSELGELKIIERTGVQRGRKIELSRKEARLRINHVRKLHPTR